MASRSLNRVILIGNLTRDPELKYTPAGTAVCTFGIATNRSWTTADGQTKEDVQYHRIVAWQKLAELCGKLLTKGRKVYLEGRLTYRNFTGKDGQQRTVAEIVLDDFIVFSDGKKAPGEEAKTESSTSSEELYNTPEDLAEESAPPSNNDKNQDVNPDDIPF
jgi:single-strand DNA-binding protein